MPAAIDWTPELIAKIEAKIVSGASIASICGSEVFPHDESTFWRKFAKDEEFASVIARAMETRTERDMEALIDLADTANESNANAVKLKIWTRMWIAGKRKPKKYGEKIEHTGEVGIKTVIVPAAAKAEGERKPKSPDFAEE